MLHISFSKITSKLSTLNLILKQIIYYKNLSHLISIY